MSLSLPTNLATAPVEVLDAKVAETQVSSLDILQHAQELKQTNFKRPKQTIQDLDELRLFQLTKRREYEQQLNKNRLNYGQWMRYAKWEIDHNHDFKRARSIMERALDVNVQHVPFWVRYVELELLHKNVNHARNLLDRGVTTLPRTDKLWYMYVQTEELLGNFRGVRRVFERWLEWRPPRAAWDSYVAFEMRYGEHANVRALYPRYVAQYPDGSTWRKWLVFETSVVPASDAQNAQIRGVFEAAVDSTLATKNDPQLVELVAMWAAWEASVDEMERARAIYGAVVEHNWLLKDQKAAVLRSYAELEKSWGSGAVSDATVRLKRKLRYEKDVALDPRDYDAWWEYVKLDDARAEELLRQAVRNVPTDTEKLVLWRRYVFLWIKLALRLEFAANDAALARSVWKDALDVVPHARFTFGKLWTNYADFELRQHDLGAARKVLGRGIGLSSQSGPKGKVFKHYIALEKRLGEADRVRKLYEKWLEVALVSGATAESVLREYIDYERAAGESDRCVALYKLAVSKPDLFDALSLLGEYVGFLKDELRYDEARDALRGALDGTAVAWITLALFELSILSPQQVELLNSADGDEMEFRVDDHQRTQTRAVFEEAYNAFKAAGNGAGAVELLASWKEYEVAHGTPDQVQKVAAKAPKEVTVRTNVGGVEEVRRAYEFPAGGPNMSRFLANAKRFALSS